MSTWRELIAEAISEKEPGAGIIACTLTAEQMDREFNSGYGPKRGIPFTAWTENRVYFPVDYDGFEWVASAPRNPCGEVMKHVGRGG